MLAHLRMFVRKARMKPCVLLHDDYVHNLIIYTTVKTPKLTLINDTCIMRRGTDIRLLNSISSNCITFRFYYAKLNVAISKSEIDKKDFNINTYTEM